MLGAPLHSTPYAATECVRVTVPCRAVPCRRFSKHCSYAVVETLRHTSVFDAQRARELVVQRDAQRPDDRVAAARQKLQVRGGGGSKWQPAVALHTNACKGKAHLHQMPCDAATGVGTSWAGRPAAAEQSRARVPRRDTHHLEAPFG